LAAGLAGAGKATGKKGDPDDARSPELLPSDPRDLPAKDQRLSVRTLETPRVPAQFDSRTKWEARAARLREQVLAAAGLWPLPKRTPLRVQIFDRVEEQDFSVEKVYFESYPQFYCTGNLFRPRGGSHKPPFPGILCPHGHWTYGRLEHSPGDENGCSVPQRCLNFARQGYVSFAYDMVGRNDSFQVPHDYGYDGKAPWGLSPECMRLHLWGVSLLGLQLWNSIRAIDFLSALPDVDPQRIAVTGASGGGTQTFLLTAVDERVKVAAPVNMISHFMQGGCLCENGPNLRIDTDNMEIGALAAPRSLLLVSATGDWTRDSERIEYPAIAAIYGLLGARDHVAHEQFPYLHNYNRASRAAVSRFFARWLSKEPGESASGQAEEKGGFSLAPDRLLVFSRRLPPTDAVDAKQLMDNLVASARTQLEAARPERSEGLETYRKQFGPVFRAALMAESPSPEELRWWPANGLVQRSARQKGNGERVILSRASVGDRIPAEVVNSRRGVQTAALIVNPDGVRAALGTADSPAPLAQELARRGCLLLSIDTFQTGEARDAARKAAGSYYTTYNRTDDMQRVQDLLTALTYLKLAWKPHRIVLVGEGLAGLWCVLARPFFSTPCAVAADVARFDSGRDEAYLDKLHIPLLRRAGDFQTAAMLAAPWPLLLHNAGSLFATEAFTQAFTLQAVTARLRVSGTELPPAEIAAWLQTCWEGG
jgi:dienelactone hydrolase